ncbi:MAG: type II toxin-antitoxin system HicB family antitoxin, partial [Gammaproteobacteria bacterium]|nr:type II toxin-antitoxin system HicB family antitoxin [Gammaproteobacteria bacterium]
MSCLPSRGWAGKAEVSRVIRYVCFIHWEGASYGVSFPDFPGCVAVGETLDAAVRQGCEALAFHV